MKNRLSFLLIFTVIMFSGCYKKKVKNNIYTEEIAKIISQVTNGKISCEDKIVVKFVNPVIKKDQLNQAFKEEVFKFSPSIKGKTYWKDLNILVFEPEKPLPFRKVYDGELNLVKVSSQFKDLKTKVLKFSFEVAGRELVSCDAELILKDRNNPKFLLYRGKIVFSEKTTLDVIKKAVGLKYKSNTIELNWDGNTNGRVFSFISQDIERDDKTKDFTFSIDKSTLDLSSEFTKEFQVTPLEDMKVVNITKIEEGRQPKIRIEFSDEFDPEQNLSGLINVKPKTDFKIQKLGNSVILDGNFKFGSEYTIVAENGIRSRWATVTKETFTSTIKFSDIKPQVEFVSNGIILPSGNKFKLQFYTANLNRVHIEVKKVYDNSLYEFMNTEQVNSNKDRKTPFQNSYDNRVGVIVHNETFEIGDTKNSWLLSEIDLSEIVNKHDKALLLIRLNFNPRDMLVDASENNDNYIEENGQIYKPLFFSDIGLTCKITNDQIIVYATDINTCKPLGGVDVQIKSFYDESAYASKTTNSDGIAEFSKNNNYYLYIQAEKDGDRSIIKFNEMQWNISGFDISGVDEFQQNTKAFIYTERGVYRPGDNINISAIIRFNDEEIPEDHVVTLEMFNPQGKKAYTVNCKKNNEGFLNFPVQTKENDPTGNWRATFNIGNKEFEKEVKIETIVPYRLKVNVDTKSTKLDWSTKSLSFAIRSNYLFGNPSANLPASVDLEITGSNKTFPNFENFVFTNPSLDFKDIQKNVFDGTLDEAGIKQIDWELPDFVNVPSALNLKITAKVLEKGGRPNINWVNITYNPYSHYVGLQPPKYSYIATGADSDIPVVVVDNDGKPTAGKTIKYRIYRNSSYWWWHYDNEYHLRFKTDNNTVLVKEGTVVSKETQNYIKFLPVEQGSYLVEASDETGTGHSAGIFIDAYPYGGAGGNDKNAGTLALYSDKNKYNVGDIANIQFPAPKDGLILLTIEKENKILEQKWYYPEKDGEFSLSIPITSEMVPNAYISVSLMQPHSQTVNDRPIRMFGILPLNVEDKDTRFAFEIQTASQYKPKELFEVLLQTTDHMEAQYTIAVVDEGLLDLTQFRTPDPWKYFFRKTRLNVQTFDLFSEIISANKGDVFKTFSIGGDMDYRESQLQPEKGRRRFKPVCMFKGPATTDANGKAVVKFTMPEYVGSVRIMVVGARQNSFASTDKAVPVKSELMVLGNLPRVIGPGEKFSIPVNVFALKENIGNVSVEIKTQGPLLVDGEKTQTLNFTKATDKDCFFSVQTKPEVGQAKVVITAKSSNYSSSYTVDLMVRPTSPRNYTSTDVTVISGQQTFLAIPADGIKGTNNATLSVSCFPATNFSHRLKWLMHYPYGCIEQTTSSVFPQLYLKKFIQYPEAFAKEIDDNINAGIQRLRKFQLYSGAFTYWPYGDKESEWGTLYAGHFLVEAKKLGYFIEDDLYENWLRYAEGSAKNNSGEPMYRVYRAYILALAGKAVMSEMNQLRESKFNELNNVEKWLLAASYQLSGSPDKVNDIIKGLNTETKDYAEFSGTFGSGLRDKAMILDALVAMKKFDKADVLTRDIAKYISATTWYSTQTIGYSLLSIGKYMEEIIKNQKNTNVKGTIQFADGSKIPFNTDKSVNIELKKGFGQKVTITLDNESALKKAYVNLSWNGVPMKSTAVDESKNIGLTVKWYDENGNSIDPTELKQGVTFWGHFHVKNNSAIENIQEIALVQILPSGWEIENARLLGESLPTWTTGFKLNKESYLDIRDDRAMWFFDLGKYDYSEADFVVKLNTVTVGEFDLAPTLVEAMYNDNFKAVKAGKKVRVVK